MGFGEHIKEVGSVLKQEIIAQGGRAAPKTTGMGAEPVAESSTSLITALLGHVGNIEDYFFPPDVIGGVCPRVPGQEESIVWNAAVEACDSERVRVVWQASGNYIWYLAVKSADLASHTNSWCPLAALLPTPNDISSLPKCYTYFGEELAILMVVAPDELHVFRGTAAVIKAKAERMAREYGNKNSPIDIVNIDLFRIGQMSPVPWYSVSLFEDRARRILASISVLASLAIIGISFAVWLLASMTMVSARHDLAQAQERTKNKTMKILNDAQNMRSSPAREQLDKFLSVNEGLLSLNGFLTFYTITDKTARWKAIVPPSATAERISSIGGKNIESSDKGAIVGNEAQLEFEAKGKKR